MKFDDIIVERREDHDDLKKHTTSERKSVEDGSLMSNHLGGSQLPKHSNFPVDDDLSNYSNVTCFIKKTKLL